MKIAGLMQTNSLKCSLDSNFPMLHIYILTVSLANEALSKPHPLTQPEGSPGSLRTKLESHKSSSVNPGFTAGWLKQWE